MKILIADDSDVVRKSLVKLILFVPGFDKPEEAKNVTNTKSKIIEFKPDVLILDINMPNGNGFDVIKTVKEQDYKITVIMLTNFTTENNKKKSIEAGINYFLDKSTEFEKVIGILKKVQKELGTV
ncbi:MAG: response regulator transcription factor [Bacteroidetes bacterium]|nr:response regulator transcription factor [Bacteroidota bacterium]MBU1679321.1 response regulator transcription factor [Bacteroidota bacterium]MBU2506952.1 response regulator transcription factor [Bacteroidota bacterium]